MIMIKIIIMIIKIILSRMDIICVLLLIFEVNYVI